MLLKVVKYCKIKDVEVLNMDFQNDLIIGFDVINKKSCLISLSGLIKNLYMMHYITNEDYQDYLNFIQK